MRIWPQGQVKKQSVILEQISILLKSVPTQYHIMNPGQPWLTYFRTELRVSSLEWYIRSASCKLQATSVLASNNQLLKQVNFAFLRPRGRETSLNDVRAPS